MSTNIHTIQEYKAQQSSDDQSSKKPLKYALTGSASRTQSSQSTRKGPSEDCDNSRDEKAITKTTPQAQSKESGGAPTGGKMLTRLTKRQKEDLTTYLDKTGSHLKNWKHLVDVIYTDISQGKRNKIKEIIEACRFGGGSAGAFLSNLNQRFPDLQVGRFRQACKAEHRNDIADVVLKDYKDVERFSDLKQSDIEDLKVKLDVEEFWVILAEETFDFDASSIDKIKTRPTNDSSKPKSCTECLLDKLGSEKSEMTVNQLAEFCGIAGTNDAKKYLESLISK